MRILVLFGGESEEREVSLRSGQRVTQALLQNGHEVTALDYAERIAELGFYEKCRAADAVFLALHGGAGEDGRLQAALEREGVFHYNGSGAAASALAMQKSRAKKVALAAGIPVARGALWMPNTPFPFDELPAVAKPESGGSSVGLRVLQSERDLQGFTPSVPFLCEEYLCGREFSVGVLEGVALPVVELRPRGGTYDYAHKYTAGATEEICPAPIDALKAQQLQALAQRAFLALGLCDYARIDFKEDAAGEARFLEANTLPGMTDTSLFPLAARVRGLSFAALCEKLAQMAAAKRLRA